ncbi:MAG: PEP-CTERM sorting domain-containing protein [Phycisphaerae bacterium]|jgi:hypothetical protein
MIKKIAMMGTLVFALAAVAHATYVWDSGASGNWSDPWTGGTNNGGNKSMITNGTVNANVNTATPNQIIEIGGTVGTGGTLTIANSSINVMDFKSGSSEIMGVGNGGTGVLNLSAGTLEVGNASTTSPYNWGTTGGQFVLYGPVSNAAYHGTVNLSGTGILMVEALRLKAKETAPGNGGVFNATGGSLYIGAASNSGIFGFGLYDATQGTGGFNLGSALLNPGGDTIVGTMLDGNAFQKQDMFAKNSTFQFDITSDFAFDTIQAWGKVFLDDPNGTDGNATVSVNLLGGYTPAKNTTFTVITTGFSATPGICGSVARLVDARGNDISNAWTATVVDTNADGVGDELQLKYIPEPATLCLLAMGGSALLIRRRNRT